MRVPSGNRADAVHDLLYRLARDHDRRSGSNPTLAYRSRNNHDLCDSSHGGPRAAATLRWSILIAGEPLNMIEIGLVHPSRNCRA